MTFKIYRTSNREVNYWIPGTGTVPETELYFGEYKPNRGTMPL